MALMAASQAGHRKVVEMLQSKGTSMQAKENDCRCSLDGGERGTTTERVEQKRKADLVAAELLQEEAEVKSSKKGKGRGRGRGMQKKEKGGAQGYGRADEGAARKGCGRAAGKDVDEESEAEGTEDRRDENDN